MAKAQTMPAVRTTRATLAAEGVPADQLAHQLNAQLGRRALEEWRKANPSPANAGEEYERYAYDPAELQALMDACGNSPTGIRNRAMIALLYSSGLRITEACALRVKDVDMGYPPSVHVLSGKGAKEGTVGLWRPKVAGWDPHAVAHLTAWLEKRQTLGINKRAPLFCAITEGVRGRPTLPSYWRRAFHRLGERAGLEVRVHPHGFRRSLASHMDKAGHSLVEIMQQLRHSSAATTDAYLTRIGPRQHLESMYGPEDEPEQDEQDMAGVVVELEAAGPPPLPFTPEQLAAMSPEQLEAAARGTVAAWIATK
jgi:integrase/recombinase XerD